MKYYIQRQLNEYGPYTLADLQRYVAQGNISLADLTRSEGMTEWVPVSQVIGNIPIPVPQAVPQQPGSSGSAYGGAAYGPPAGAVYAGAQSMPFAAGPMPPDFHWALVLVMGIITCGVFWWAWSIVEAIYVRKIKPSSHGLLLLILACVIYYAGASTNGYLRFTHPGEPTFWGLPFTLVSWVLWLVAAFQMSHDLEEHYNSAEPINLRLNGAMVFFFAVWYFQHHFSRIAQWKKTGYLQPQG